MESRQYEFSPSQNELIQDLAGKMRFVGFLLFTVGTLSIIGGIIAIFFFFVGQTGVVDLGGIIQGIFFILVGYWTIKAGAAFKRIVDTQGNDLENLMGALSELRKLYTLQYWLAILLLIFIGLALILGIFAIF